MDPTFSGHRVYTRDGSCFQLTLPATPGEEKAFQLNTPSCDNTSAISVRRWYKHFSNVAARFKVYVHPYYCFRPDSGSTRGFSCGKDTDTVSHDLPIRYDINIPQWGNLIYSAISNPKVFPKGSSLRSTVIDHYGDGYAALYAIISSTHPAVISQPSLLVTYPPKQGPRDPIGRYFHAYKDYLEMKAYVDNIAQNLNYKGELDRFIAGTVYHADFT